MRERHTHTHTHTHTHRERVVDISEGGDIGRQPEEEHSSDVYFPSGSATYGMPLVQIRVEFSEKMTAFIQISDVAREPGDV